MLRKRAPNFDIFSSEVCYGRMKLKHVEEQKFSRSMLPQKVFENLPTVMAILVLFEQFSGKLCLLDFNSEASPNKSFYSHCFDYCAASRAQGVKLIVIKEVRNDGKIVFIINIFENGWWGMHCAQCNSQSQKCP